MSLQLSKFGLFNTIGMPSYIIYHLPLLILLVLTLMSSFFVSDSLMHGVSSAKEFGFYALMAGMSVFLSLRMFTHSKTIGVSFNISDVLIMIWWLYTFFRIWFTPGIGWDNTSFITLSLLVVFYFILKHSFRQGFTKYILTFTFLLAGLGQAVYGLLQLYGYQSSFHGLSLVTGSFFNSGPYGGFLASVFPMALGIYLQSSDGLKPIVNLSFSLTKYLALTTCASILLVLPATQSRAAWLATIAGAIVVFSFKYQLLSTMKVWLNTSLKKVSAVIILMIIIAGLLLALYQLKPASASGRLLIWNVTLNMIKDQPVFGAGYDTYSAAFAPYQVEYFIHHPDSPEAMVSGKGEYAFNEFLKIGAEQGIVGLLLFLGVMLSIFRFKVNKKQEQSIITNFLVNPQKAFTLVKQHSGKDSRFHGGSTALRNDRASPGQYSVGCGSGNSRSPLHILLNRVSLNMSCRRHLVRDEGRAPESSNGVDKISSTSTIGALASLVAILIFACFSYPFSMIPIQINLFFALAMLSADKQAVLSFKISQVLGRFLIPLLTLLLIGYFTFYQINRYHAYQQWQNAAQYKRYSSYGEAANIYKSIYPVLQQEGEFLFHYGQTLFLLEDYQQAVNTLEQAKLRTTDPYLYTSLGSSYQALKQYDKAEDNIQFAANLNPYRFYPRYLLAKLYEEKGDRKAAIGIAKEIMQMEVKVPSSAVEEIKEEMQKLIRKLE